MEKKIIITAGIWINIAQAVRLLGLAIAYPIIIRKFGASELGYYLSSVAIAGFIQLLDFGTLLPWQNRIAKASKSKTISRKLGVIINSGICAYTFTASGLIFVALFLENNILRYLIFQNSLLLIIRAIRSIQKGEGQYVAAAVSESKYEFIMNSMLILGLYAFNDLSAALIAQVFGQLMYLIIQVKIISIKRSIEFVKPKYWPHVMLRKNVAYFNLTSISNYINTNQAIYLISYLVSKEAVALYSSVKLMSNIPRMLFSALVVASVPIIAAHKRGVRDSRFIGAWIYKLGLLWSIISLCGMVFLGSTIFEIWMKIQSDISRNLIYLFAILFVCDIGRMVFHDQLLGLSEFGVVAKIDIATSMATLTLSWIAINFLGSIGAVVAQIIIAVAASSIFYMKWKDRLACICEHGNNNLKK